MFLQRMLRPISISILVAALTILTFLFLPDVNLIQAGINEWTTQGPPGADITVLTIDPIITNTIYAGTFNGLYKSIDGGNSWNIIDIGAPVGSTSISILDIATAHVMSSTVIYISTSGYGVYKSIDEGLTWVNSLDIGGGINALAVDPLIPTTVYAGNAPMGVYKSEDSGQTWKLMNVGLLNTSVNDVAIDPITPSILYAGTFDGVFKSFDGGTSWTAVNNGLSNTFIDDLVIDPLTPTTIYANLSNDGLFKSTNGGNNWIPGNGNLPSSGGSPVVINLAVNPITSTTLYASLLSDGIYKSTDGGNN